MVGGSPARSRFKEVSVPMSVKTDEAVLRAGDQELDFPVVRATEGSDAYDVSGLLSRPGASPSTPASSTPAPAARRSPSSTATRASCATAGTHRAAGRELHLPRDLLPAHLRRAADQQRARGVHDQIRRHTLLHEDLRASSTASPADAHPMPVLSSAVVGAVDLLPGQPRPLIDAEQVELSTDPADGQAADDRRLRVQEVASASRSSTRTTRSTSWRTSCA